MDSVALSRDLKSTMGSRRSIRSYAHRPVPVEVVENCITIACSAPSGANMQPWTFVLVGDHQKKAEIRSAAEEVEGEFYEHKISAEWRRRLVPLHVDQHKPFLTEAPWLIGVFVQKYGIDDDGETIKHFYPVESTGIAVGFLLCALHQIGLGALTYTPKPMSFLSSVLDRPPNERPYMIIAVGYPSPTFEPPDIQRKAIDTMLVRV